MTEHSGILSNGVQVASLLQCPHCGRHFESRPGSGHTRQFCFRCMKVCCGAKACVECIPLEARLEHAEGRTTRYDDEIERLTNQGAILL